MLHGGRYIYFIVFLLCGGLLSFGVYLQFNNGLEPCPLCIVQRIFFAAIGVVALIAALHGPKRTGHVIYGVALCLLAVGGAIVAGRQVWLQHLPPEQVPECGPGLDYLLEVYPPSDVLSKIFEASGDCAEVAWRFLGLSIPEWALAMFLFIIAASVWRIYASRTITPCMPGG